MNIIIIIIIIDGFHIIDPQTHSSISSVSVPFNKTHMNTGWD